MIKLKGGKIKKEPEGSAVSKSVNTVSVNALAKESKKEQEGQFKVVELVEVVTHKGAETSQPSTARHQYINLDSSVTPDAPHPEYGRAIKFKARVEWISGDKSKPLSGKSVHWYSKPGGGNKAGLAGQDKEGFVSAGGDASQSVTTTADGWTPVVTFHLSQYGGDQFTVYATEDSAKKGGRPSGTFTVWRKLWFEVDTMKKRGGGTLDMDHAGLPKLYESCFIELEKQGTDNQPGNTWNLETSGLHAFANDYFGAERSPFESHEVAIDHQADRADGDLEVELTADTYIHGDVESYYVYDGGTTWLKTAQYDDGSGYKALDKSKVTLAGANKVYKQIKIDLTTGPVKPTVAKPVKVKLTFIQAKEWSGDGSNTPHAMVAMGYWYDTESEGEAKKRTLGTMAHELGHLLGMVPTSSSTYVDTGTGHHCTDASCVMFSTNTATRGNNFCNVCLEELRKADLVQFKGTFTHGKGAKA
jgi:hypothetical protein